MRMQALRYGFYNLLMIFTFVGFLIGQGWLWLGFAFLLLISTIGDRFLPPDRIELRDANPWLMNALLYSILPLLYLNVLAFIWQMAPQDWRY